MSYSNPDILLFTNPVGIDAVVQSIQQDLYYGLPWLSKSFGRAYEFKEGYQDGSSVKSKRVPKAFIGVTDTGQGEYYDVLPNDNVTAQSFIAVKGFETWPLAEEFSKYNSNGLTRQLSVIFWVNLKVLEPTKEYIWTEELKVEVEKILKKNAYVYEILRYVDERAEDVFDSYDLRTVQYTNEDDETQYLMYPYAGFRFDVTVKYPEYATCTQISLPFQTPFATGFDVEWTAVGGETTYQSDSFVGRKVRVTRGGMVQYQTGTGTFFTFDSTTGTVGFSPAADPGEIFGFEVYGYD